MKIEVKIGTVDMEGFCGRDLHPEPTDSGKTGELIKMETITDEQWWDGEPENSNDFTFQLFTVKMDDGRLVEFVEFEVESIMGGREWTQM